MELQKKILSIILQKNIRKINATNELQKFIQERNALLVLQKRKELQTPKTLIKLQKVKKLGNLKNLEILQFYFSAIFSDF
jgi:hypothetical protein